MGSGALNIGSEPFDGEVTITFDENLMVSGIGAGWSTSDATSATWNINNQAPGSAATYGINIAGPSVDLIGQELDLSVSVTLTDQDGAEFYQESHDLTVTVICAYDPNDKTLMSPDTYSEEEFLDPETETISYRVRFQNTGNAPAQNVVIEDLIDLSKFDITSLAPTFGSHPFYTLIENDGRAKFVFDNIWLPDSTADLEASQGEVFFNIDLLAGLSPGDVIENTAEIYFDSNPAVVTNTTGNTLFDCNWMQASANETFCAGAIASVAPTLVLADSYSWVVDGPTGEPTNLPTDALGVFEFPIYLNNPFCTNHIEFLPYEVQAFIVEDLDVNGLINSADVLMVLGEFGCIAACETDVNSDGITSIEDILQVLGQYGASCN